MVDEDIYTADSYDCIYPKKYQDENQLSLTLSINGFWKRIQKHTEDDLAGVELLLLILTLSLLWMRDFQSNITKDKNSKNFFWLEQIHFVIMNGSLVR